MPQSRQLAAIMFTDIVGYTALMGDDEQRAFELLNTNRDIHQPIINLYNGKLIKEMGDGILATFPTVSDALYAAVKIQQACSASKELSLRVGIHEGEIIIENNDVYGDVVNIASRIQTLGTPGSILFSKKVADEIKNKAEFKTVSLGSFELKNVDEPMEVFALANEGLSVPKREEMRGKLKVEPTKIIMAPHKKWIAVLTSTLLIIIALVIYSVFTSRTAFTGKDKSIAVLPFVNIGDDPSQDYLSDGITEEIITQLSKIAELKVISRSTAMLYKNSKKPVKQIAEEMNVSTILEGSVQKSGDEIRITAQLIDANTQEHIWAEHYDHRNLNEIFAIQSEVAQRIAHELNARLSKEEKIKIETKPTDNPEAYDLFLKGRYAYNYSTLEGFHNAETFFLKAIKKDPKFRLAYSFLANVYISLTVWAGDLPPSTGANKAMSVLNEVLQKDTLFIDFATLAFIEFWANKNFKKAEYYFNKAISLNPNDELSYIVYAILLTNLGRTEEAFVQLDKAKTISPVNAFEIQQRAEAFYSCGRYDEAIKLFKEAIEVFPDVNGLYDVLGRVYVVKENYQDAINILRKGLTHSAKRPPSTLVFMAIAYFKMNNPGKATELIQELKQRVNNGEKGINIFIAIFYSAIKNKEEAFNYLDHAFKTNDVDLIWLKQEPSFTNLHGDPRYQVYLKRAGF